MFQRDVFASGEYVEQFKPDDPDNQFHAIYGQKRADILAHVKHNLPPEGVVLDLGGGMGRMAIPLAMHRRVVLCDLSPDMLRLAEAAASENQIPPDRLSTQCLDASKPLPFPTASFDCVLSIDLLVHVPDPAPTLREIYRVLKPGGEALIDMTNGVPWWTLSYPRYVGRRPGRWLQTWKGGGVLPEWQSIVRHYPRGHYHAMLIAAGFSISREWCYGPRWCPKWFLSLCRRSGE